MTNRVKMKKMPAVRVVRRIMNDTNIKYIPQINWRSGWGWHNLYRESSFYDDILLLGLPTYQEEVIKLLLESETNAYRSDWAYLFENYDDAVVFADKAYAIFEKAYPGYQKAINEKNGKIANLPKDNEEVYRKPPKWEWLKNIFG